ncbi:MAG: DMT family transporter [Pseudomonadota bacterium]
MNLSGNMAGAALMTGSMAGFAVNDALMKSLAGDAPLFQAIFIRGLFAAALIGVLAWRMGALKRTAIAPGDGRMVLFRLVGEIGTTTCFLSALFSMPIANATAILQGSPFVLTFAAALLLGERVGWRRWLAVFVGFFGVLMIVRPGLDGFNPASWWALSAVGFIVLRDLATRRISPATPSLFITFLTAVNIAVLGAVVTGFRGWEPIEGGSVMIMACSAIFLLCGYYCSVGAVRLGEIGFVSPFRYSVLIWAILLGIFVFGEIPDQLTVIGVVIIVLAGLYTFFRERRV